MILNAGEALAAINLLFGEVASIKGVFFWGGVHLMLKLLSPLCNSRFLQGRFFFWTVIQGSYPIRVESAPNLQNPTNLRLKYCKNLDFLFVYSGTCSFEHLKLSRTWDMGIAWYSHGEINAYILHIIAYIYIYIQCLHWKCKWMVLANLRYPAPKNGWRMFPSQSSQWHRIVRIIWIYLRSVEI